MVNLVIMRHGEAEPQYLSDSERQLTAAGQAEVSQMAEWLHHHYSAFDQIFSSPYRRTQQTAALLVQKGLTAQAVELNTDLVPEGNAQLVVDFLDLLNTLAPLLPTLEAQIILNLDQRLETAWTQLLQDLPKHSEVHLCNADIERLMRLRGNGGNGGRHAGSRSGANWRTGLIMAHPSYIVNGITNTLK